MDGRDEAVGAVRASEDLDERPPDAPRGRIDKPLDGSGEVPKMQGATLSALRHGRRLFIHPVVVEKVKFICTEAR